MKRRDNLLNELRTIRDKLLENKNIKTYLDILDFMDLPDEDKIKDIEASVDSEICDITKNAMIQIVNTYEDDNNRYQNEILYGQRIIWGQVYDSYKKLIDIYEGVNTYRIEIYDEYIKACKEIKRVMSFCAEAQAQMSRFEDALGIDRYLDKLGNRDVVPLQNLVADINKITEVKLNTYKKVFVKQWSTVNVSKMILHELVRYDGSNQICTLFDTNIDKVVLFIIDGFGYGQYLWHKRLNNIKNYTYNENIFSWLDNSGALKEYVLGSAYITDTGAGLAQIFIGEQANNTGILSSKLCTETGNLIETKRLEKVDFKNIFKTDKKSITEIIKVFGKESKVFYGSKYNTKNITGFSDFIFEGAKVTEVIPSERIFGILRDDLLKQKSGLDIVYMTDIDNSGHSMGAYSKFEKYEHEKFNILFRNFLIETAIESPELFNDKTTLLITADHGMAESSKIMINRKDIKEKFYEVGITGCNFIENNRALLIYGVWKNKYELACNCIKEMFNSIDVEYDILVKGMKEYSEFMGNVDDKVESLFPDIIVRCVGNALFYSRNKSEHLLHFGGHGGGSVGEVFVPLLQVKLSKELLKSISERFIRIM